MYGRSNNTVKLSFLYAAGLFCHVAGDVCGAWRLKVSLFMFNFVPQFYTYFIMRIAVPTREGRVDDHFGHCDHYTVFTIEENNVVEKFDMPSPQGCGCKSGIAADLQQLGVEVMLAGNMGEGAKNKLSAHCIKVVRGCSGDVDALVERYLAGEVDDSGYSCSSHECGDHAHGDKMKIVGYSAAAKKD